MEGAKLECCPFQASRQHSLMVACHAPHASLRSCQSKTKEPLGKFLLKLKPPKRSKGSNPGTRESGTTFVEML